MGDFMNNVVYTTEMNKYAFFEKGSPSAFTRVCIDGHITGSNKCVGYKAKDISGRIFTISIEKVISLHKSLCDEENSMFVGNLN